LRRLDRLWRLHGEAAPTPASGTIRVPASPVSVAEKTAAFFATGRKLRGRLNGGARQHCT
jgi:hypothetical protein